MQEFVVLCPVLDTIQNLSLNLLKVKRKWVGKTQLEEEKERRLKVSRVDFSANHIHS
jgi:hypothetical protein